MPTTDEKVLAVLRAARKRLKKAREHKVGLSSEEVAALDRLLRAGEQELSNEISGDEIPVVPTNRLNDIEAR